MPAPLSGWACFAPCRQVIGVRGANVRTVRTQSGASVDIERNEGSETSRQISLTGEPSQVEAAEKLIWCAPADFLFSAPRTGRLYRCPPLVLRRLRVFLRVVLLLLLLPLPLPLLLLLAAAAAAAS